MGGCAAAGCTGQCHRGRGALIILLLHPVFLWFDWEGLGELLDSQGQRVGLGYLEMTGYAGALRL